MPCCLFPLLENFNQKDSNKTEKYCFAQEWDNFQADSNKVWTLKVLGERQRSMGIAHKDVVIYTMHTQLEV